VQSSAIQKLLDQFHEALRDGSFVKLTLSSPRGADRSLKQIHVRAIELRDVPHLSFVYHHKERDVTKNFAWAEGISVVTEILGRDFRNAHLFTTQRSWQLEIRERGGARLLERPARHEVPPPRTHDQRKERRILPTRPWLHALGVTTAEGTICRGMEAKFRQIDRFVEIMTSLLNDADLPSTPLSIVDMGCGKGYLTFGLFDVLSRDSAREVGIQGIEAREELVALGNRVARAQQFHGLTFEKGAIADVRLTAIDVVIALHACDTATDDALAKGIGAGARLIVVSPCCHKELRAQLVAPAALESTLKHGILRERQAEFITDALRAALLEWAGYDTSVFEFTSTEHTAKNLMIAAVRREKPAASSAAAGQRVQALASMYGIRSQRLAEVLGFTLGNAG
jgi:Methyltransferase domain